MDKRKYYCNGKVMFIIATIGHISVFLLFAVLFAIHTKSIPMGLLIGVFFAIVDICVDLFISRPVYTIFHFDKNEVVFRHCGRVVNRFKYDEIKRIEIKRFESWRFRKLYPMRISIVIIRNESDLLLLAESNVYSMSIFNKLVKSDDFAVMAATEENLEAIRNHFPEVTIEDPNGLLSQI